MVNKILKEINDWKWFTLFQWQMEDGKLCILFRRVSVPQFVIFVSGYDESRLYGKAQVEIASMEKFIKENEIESKWTQFKSRSDGVFEKVSFE